MRNRPRPRERSRRVFTRDQSELGRGNSPSPTAHFAIALLRWPRGTARVIIESSPKGRAACSDFPKSIWLRKNRSLIEFAFTCGIRRPFPVISACIKGERCPKAQPAFSLQFLVRGSLSVAQTAPAAPWFAACYCVLLEWILTGGWHVRFTHNPGARS